MLHRDLDGRLAGERDDAGEELVEDDAGRVEIGALVDRGSPRLLGREILSRPDDRARLGHLAGPGPGDAEVGHLDAPLAVDEDVVGLDVAVDDPVLVGVPEGGEDLAGVRDRDGNGARAARHDQLLERAALDVLHHDEVRPVDDAAVVDRDDVRMRQPGRMGGLAPEPLHELLVARVPLVQDLHGHAPAELLILGEPDVGHAA